MKIFSWKIAITSIIIGLFGGTVCGLDVGTRFCPHEGWKFGLIMFTVLTILAWVFLVIEFAGDDQNKKV